MEAVNLSQIWTAFVLFLPRLGIAVLIFFVFWVISRVNRGLVQRFAYSKRLSPDIVSLLMQVTETTLLIFGIVTALGTLGINVSAMIASLGLVGFALGFALRDLLSNFLSGLLILMYRPFVRGDHISVSDNKGRVTEINLRYTVLQAEDKQILIPNATLFSNAVTVQKQAPDRTPEVRSEI